MIKKLFKKLHLWLSLPFGLIISIVCFTGAILVFETEITEWLHPDRYFVGEVRAEAIPMDELLNTVSATLPDSVTITGVTVSPDPRRAYLMKLSKPRRAAIAIDQYTGEVKGKIERPPFFTFTMRAHRWLLDSMKPKGEFFLGRMIVGVSTLLFVVILITGMVIWWPRNLKYLKEQMKIPVRRGWSRFWYGLHSAGGMYVLILLLVMALTGLTWSFGWYRTGFYQLFGVEQTRGWIYSVHVGSWGGMFTRVLWFIAALVGGILPLTGYYIWIRRRFRKKRA